MRLVTSDGIEYDAEDGSTEEVRDSSLSPALTRACSKISALVLRHRSTSQVEVVISAVGPPCVFLSHSWKGSFRDTVDACVAWCHEQGMDVASVYVWIDGGASPSPWVLQV